ncbi:Mitochondrial-processing peptidase subunit alpha [Irineochytrium annulatum]|nr:Mitochondrial-processing peptidase subunit alpha [Irineochytrium annulatum]
MPADGTTITTLPNGLRVASMDVPGHFVSFGVFVTTGTRYESDKLAGVTHVMDRMAFKSTENMTAEKLVAAIETVGGSVMAHSARESIVYQASVFPKDVPRIAEIFSDVIRRPRFLPEELDDVKDAVRFEVADSQFKMDLLLPERVHEIAYGGVAASPSKLMNGWQSLFGLGNGAAASQPTLGRPMMCALDRLETMTVDHLREYHSTWYTPDRLIVVCVGMPHEDVLRVVVPTFGDMAPTRPEVRALQQNMTHRAVYKGGIVINDTTEEAKSPNPDDRLLTHVYVGFEAPGVLDPDVYAIATLAQLMGGGGSFSAGGPGKGMYSRLYTQVLNRNHWIDSLSIKFSFTYDDTGLFGISAAIPPDAATHSHVLPIIFDQLVRMCDGYTDLEVSRAKNQLKSNVLMALESRGVELEDIGKQVMSLGRRVSAVETCERIDAVTGADLVRVAMRMVAGLDVPSPFVFKDGMKREQWKPAAPGKATVLIHGPVGAKDPLMKVETTMREWGLQV